METVFVGIFYFAEGSGHWQALSATTLTAAKREATRLQAFVGTGLWIGAPDPDGFIIPIAKKLHRDALDL